MDYVIKILEIVVSIPAVLFLFIILFREQLAGILKNVEEITLGNLLHAKTQRTEQPKEENTLKLTKEEIEQVRTEFENLNKSIVEKNEVIDTAVTQIENKDNLITFLMDRLNYFEFLYLDNYFVPRTKILLKWIASQVIVDRSTIMETFQTLPAGELEAMIKVLKDAYMIKEDENRLQIYPRGQLFLQFINYK